MVTYPNQRVVTIFKEDCKKDFLQVNNEDWQTAAATLSHGGLKLYLYLASNKAGFILALSPADLENKIGLSDSTYRRAFKELESLGYIQFKSGNLYWFNSRV